MRTVGLTLTSLVSLLFGAAGAGCAPSLSDAGSLADHRDGATTATGTGGRDAAAPGDTRFSGDDCCLPDGFGSADGDGASAGLSAADLSGTWSGTTSQGEPITFTVDSAGLVSWQFGWQLPACGSSVEGTFPPASISSGQVTRSVPAGPGGLSVTMTISFLSTASAAGSIDFTLTQAPAGGCSGQGTATFTAGRVP